MGVVLVFVGVSLINLLDLAGGTKITLSGNPASITPSLTSSMTLRCSLDDSFISAGNTIIGRRDVTDHTDYDVQRVSSIIISREGKDIAAISQGSAARLLVNDTNIQVSGDLTGGSGEKGYLELTWTYPEGDQVGDFTCEANAANDIGRNIVYSASKNIPAKDPTVMDLVKQIHDMQLDKEQTQQTVERLKHVETGVIQCSHSSRWPGHTHDRQGYSVLYKDVTVKFDKPYTSVPQVKVGVEDLITYGGSHATLGSDVIKVTSTDFTVRCSTWAPGGNTMGGIHSMAVSWISVPKF